MATPRDEPHTQVKQFTQPNSSVKNKRNPNRVQRSAYPSFETQMADEKMNRYFGESFAKVMKSTNESMRRDLIADVNGQSSGNKQLNTWRLAVHKARKLIRPTLTLEEQASFEKLTDVEVRDILVLDDPLSTAVSVGSGLYTAYKSPHVKKFVDGLVSRGVEKVTSLWKSSSPSPSPSLQTKQPGYLSSGDTTQNVQLDFIFGALTQSLPTLADPFDAPKMVYSNQFSKDITINCNSAGAAVLLIQASHLFSSNVTATDEAFMAVAHSATYDPYSHVVPTYVRYPSPLAPSAGLMGRAKVLGLELVVTPTMSAVNNKGAYVVGTFPEAMTNGDDHIMSEEFLTYDDLSTVPGFVISDMKTSVTTRVYPSPDPLGRAFNTVPATEQMTMDFHTFVLSIRGAEDGAQLSVKYTLMWSGLPTLDGQVIVRGSLPSYGPHTMFFAEFLRVRFPDIIHWEAPKILDLYQFLKSSGQTSLESLQAVAGKFRK